MRRLFVQAAVCRVAQFTFLCSAMVLLGCGPGGPPQYHVSGTVTYGGQPVPTGQVLFAPDTSKGNSGPATAVRIQDGKYDTRGANRGTVGGPHVVTISGFDGKPDPNAELPEGRMLFSDYRVEIDLPKEAATENFAVPAGVR